jgi:predicted ester cyclase
MKASEMSSETVEGSAELARGALERVCSGAGLEAAERYYSPSFVDHVNGRDFHGLQGAEESVALYRRLIKDMSIRVDQQVVEADVVTSRFTVSGSIYGKRVAFGGITISRFENGKIVEDWSVTDTVSMLRQIGFLRSLLLIARRE